MIIESRVLSGYESLYEVRREIRVFHVYSVLTAFVPRAEHFSVGTIYLGGISVDRILQVFHVRHIAHPSIPDGYEKDKDSQDRCRKKYPQRVYQFFSHLFLLVKLLDFIIVVLSRKSGLPAYRLQKYNNSL